MMKIAIAAVLAATLPALACAHDYTAGDVEVHHPYAFETAPTAMTGAGYMTLTNTGREGDALIAVRADFPKVTLHLSEETDGVARMSHVDRIAIAPGETVELTPGGYHVMFMGLEGDPFDDGEKIPAILVFARSGEVEVTFNVEPRGDGTAEAGHSTHGSH